MKKQIALGVLVLVVLVSAAGMAFSFLLIARNKQDKPINDVPPMGPFKEDNRNTRDPNYEPDYAIYNGRKHTVINPNLLRDIETGEVIDLRIEARTKSDNH